MLVTATGIGAALALAYAAQKCRVALHSSRAVAENLAKTIRNGGGEVFPVQGDFAIAADVERVVTRKISAGPGQQCRLGRVPYAELTEAHYDADLNPAPC